MEVQKIWEYIDEAVFCGSNIILCLAMFCVYFEVFILNRFRKYLDILTFSYLFMWLVSTIAVITSNYYYYYVHLAIVMMTFLAIILFSLCLTAKFCSENDSKMQQQRASSDKTARTRSESPSCRHVPLHDDGQSKKIGGKTADEGTSFHGIRAVR
ncbi:unnamed protein product [Acanthoscelides obtectus]|nr:unnamed protein product [Acanthoscelides obtectus]CAK1636275.1 hypothetical protein AOBTE_LOCUS9797 [Acanthoscelides obtectus]